MCVSPVRQRAPFVFVTWPRPVTPRVDTVEKLPGSMRFVANAIVSLVFSEPKAPY